MGKRPIAAFALSVVLIAIVTGGARSQPAQPEQSGSASTAAGTEGATRAQSHSETILFDGGGSEELNGITYHSFRIPSLVRTTEDTLIAFVEGRHRHNGDYGNINLLYKRSTDDGRTWSGLHEVEGSGEGVWGNPTAVVDQDTGTIWLFMNHQPPGDDDGAADSWDDRQVWVTSSTDDGQTWADPEDLTEELKPRENDYGDPWNWDAVGPGVGIQTSAQNPGRLVIPAQHRFIYSDDHGETWQFEILRDAAGDPLYETGESTVVELTDGRLYRNDRPVSWAHEESKRRWVTRGTIENGFEQFSPARCLLDPKSQGSVMRYNSDDPARLAFVNSASSETRTKMRIRMSEDEGRTWSYSRPFADAPLPGESSTYREGGYSSIAKTADYHVGALVEVNEDTGNNDDSHRSIAFRKVNLPWIQAGVSEPDCTE